jgi:hypothetical protein
MSKVMKIVSHFLPQEGIGRYFAFSTAVGTQKVLTTAMGIGDGAHISETGQRALAIAGAHAGHPQEILFVPISAPTAKARAQKHVERSLR